MNTRLEKSVRSSDEWYTPKEILDALGKFDLDRPEIGRTWQRHCIIIQPLRFQNVSGRHLSKSDGNEIPTPPHPILPTRRSTR